MKKVVIIGAGPAGLAAGYRLCDYKINPIILEEDSGVGGLSRTIRYKGYYFDIGGHRFFTKNSLVFSNVYNIGFAKLELDLINIQKKLAETLAEIIDIKLLFIQN